MKIKTNLLLASVIALTSVSFSFSSASAQGNVAAKSGKAVEVQGMKGGNPGTTNATVTATTTSAVDNTQTPQDKTKINKPVKVGRVTGAEHRSVVANFVQNLLAVADREGGIGQEVRVIAQQQNDTKDRVADLINAVEGRSAIKTFFIGTSYKNLGELRSKMVVTNDQIEQLKRLADKAENDQDKTELQAQIQTLQQQQAGISTFITQNESRFSLFGWAVKLFRK